MALPSSDKGFNGLQMQLVVSMFLAPDHLCA